MGGWVNGMIHTQAPSFGLSFAPTSYLISQSGESQPHSQLSLLGSGVPLGGGAKAHPGQEAGRRKEAFPSHYLQPFKARRRGRDVRQSMQ